jgi:hypothetical protein
MTDLQKIRGHIPVKMEYDLLSFVSQQSFFEAELNKQQKFKRT